MREILFRAKRLDNGEWVQGCYENCTHQYSGFIKHFIRVAMYGEENDCGEEFLYLVDPETVCQYTGLADKNGAKIFEGDVVSTDTKRPYLIVEFRDGCFMFNCNDGGEDYYDIMLPILNEPQTQYKYGEVIGNIFDNPELMEGGAE